MSLCETPEEKQARILKQIEDDLRRGVDDSIIGQPSTEETLRSVEETHTDLLERQGMHDVRVRARSVWQCPMPLEPEPPTFYPGLGVRIRWNRGIAVIAEGGPYPKTHVDNETGVVVRVEDSKVVSIGGQAVVVELDRTGEEEVCLAGQLVPLGPSRERRYCSHKVRATFLARLKLHLFGNAGRCPLHGLHLQNSIDVHAEGRFPPQDFVNATITVV